MLILCTHLVKLALPLLEQFDTRRLKAILLLFYFFKKASKFIALKLQIILTELFLAKSNLKQTGVAFLIQN